MYKMGYASKPNFLLGGEHCIKLIKEYASKPNFLLGGEHCIKLMKGYASKPRRGTLYKAC